MMGAQRFTWLQVMGELTLCGFSWSVERIPTFSIAGATDRSMMPSGAGMLRLLRRFSQFRTARKSAEPNPISLG
jgi:hypothetical protein